MENYIEAVKSANQNHYLMCYSFALSFIKGKDRFTSEDIIIAYKKSDNSQPDEARVWGAVFRELLKYDYITHIGFDTAKIKSSHQKPINVWKSLI